MDRTDAPEIRNRKSPGSAEPLSSVSDPNFTSMRFHLARRARW